MQRLDDGHSTRITFLSGESLTGRTPILPDGETELAFWEREVTPPGISAGGANDVTNMRNEEWRTMSPKKLKTLSPAQATVAYDPVTITRDVVDLLIGKNVRIEFKFADDSYLLIWGWLDTFVPASTKEGDPATAEITIIPSNHDNASPFGEQGPQYDAGPEVPAWA